jgi:hypothetical protein
MSPIGPSPTYRNVCQLAALGSEADISQPSPCGTSACSVMTVSTVCLFLPLQVVHRGWSRKWATQGSMSLTASRAGEG